MSTQARHIDQAARMVWITLKKGGMWRVDELVTHWQPTFNRDEMLDILRRLEANGCAVRKGAFWAVGTASIPGIDLRRAA